MIGIDAKIERLKVLFEQGLFLDYSYNSYGRAFLNDRDGEVVPEILIDDTHEYKEVLLDDTIAASSFFVVRNDYTVKNSLVSGAVDIYFSVNLKTVYPDVTERALEYLHRDVSKIINGESFELANITSGKDAFSDFDIRLGDNMQPYYLAKFVTNTNWLYNECVNVPDNAIVYENDNFIAMEDDSILIQG